MKNTLGI